MALMPNPRMAGRVYRLRLPIFHRIGDRHSEFPLCLEMKGVKRPQLEAAVERLIAMLDEMDGDPDLEPSLGGFSHGFPVDAEEEDEHGGDICDERHDDEDEDTGIGDRAALGEVQDDAAAWQLFEYVNSPERREVMASLRRRAQEMRIRTELRKDRDPDRLHVLRPGVAFCGRSAGGAS